MTKTTTARFTKGEELANTLSHAIGLALAIAGLVLLILNALHYNNPLHLISNTVFGTTMVILYLSSALNHGLPHGKAKDFFHNFDQVAIFLLIAGTYTPLALVALHGDWGWTLFACQWGFALSGITAKLFLPNRFEKGVNIFFVLSYILMGWMLLFFIIPFIHNIPRTGLFYIFLGGFCYTIGTVFFKLKNLPYAHLIWHVFVLAGTFFHWWAILNYL